MTPQVCIPAAESARIALTIAALTPLTLYGWFQFYDNHLREPVDAAIWWLITRLAGED